MTGINEIRTRFLDYFARNDHAIVASGPLVARNDPTLLFTGAGMVPFKTVFTGAEKRPYGRAATAQKCLRAGGKHNDLDKVGYTARHHTFFEMLGNFSFGDYFKETAIELAWTLVAHEFALPAERLTVTVYHDDDEAFHLWRRIAGLPEDRIIRITTSDNFWTMGDVGPCGPCSEIFYDHGPDIPGGPPGSAREDGDRFVEIWNLVFMQYEQVSRDKRVALPRPSIDTGMGLERIAAVLQGTYDNYEIDLFKTLIGACENITGVAAQGRFKASHRVIADHLRAVSFLIAEGVSPANEGRGYVLRRIMRRAMRHAHLLGAKEPLMGRLVPTLIGEMGQSYPQLAQAEALITETLDLEERRFRHTLERGLNILDEETSGIAKGGQLSGDIAFRLYDTYGFPIDLTRDALKSRGIGVDLDGFEAAMQRQRSQARKAWSGSGEVAAESVWFTLAETLGVSEFLGYECETAEGIVTGIVVNAKSVSSLEEGESGAVIANRTPFYARLGGQIGDRGVIRTKNGGLFRVTDTHKRAGGLIVHSGYMEHGALTHNQAVSLEIDHEMRRGLRVHHSATHLIHEALRQVLGDHVMQKGSLVEANRMRFDFSHPRVLEKREIAQVEDLANRIVAQNDPVTTRLMSADEAIAEGARALFGEKYGEEVRVVCMGRQSAGDGHGEVFSMELCGGTHVGHTGAIGMIKIVAESASAAGVRRIEAVAGDPARAYLTAQNELVEEASAILNVPAGDLVDRVTTLIAEQRRLERALAEARRKLAFGGCGINGNGDIEEIGNVKVMTRVLPGIQPKELRGLVDDGKKALGSGIVALIGVSEEGKAALAVGVTHDLTQMCSAIDLVRIGALPLGGKGSGGRPDMAQTGGPDGAGAPNAIAAIRDRIRECAAHST
ncbi:MAG: alanine--tRNA ligase [Hyphomicrobiales bacterium]